jgi:type IV secretory pathway TrbF-like protein
MAERQRGQPARSSAPRKETVSIEIASVLPQTPTPGKSIGWRRPATGRAIVKGLPVRMRALVTVYTVEPPPKTTEEQVRNNPLGIYVRDFSWSKQL